MKIGYACINNALAEKDIYVTRSMVKRTFLAKGIRYASELALRNIMDLEQVVKWNVRFKILFYRLSSDMFPWMSEYELSELPDFTAISETLSRVGRLAMENNLRLTFHPGPFNVLATSNARVLANTLKELRQHGEIMDLLKLPRSPYAKINIHIGASYGDKEAALNRFCENAITLDDSALTRLTVENDDKANMFSVADLMVVYKRVGIPIVFDYLHHQFCTGNLSEQNALENALSTWPDDIVPVVHYSSSKKTFEDSEAPEAAHADFIYEPITTYGHEFDIMLEAKAKELAVKKYLKQFSAAHI